MADNLDERRKRAVGRQRWPVVKAKLDANNDDLSATTTPIERLAMVWSLTQEAWKLARRVIPTYSRHEITARIYRRGDVIPNAS
ncbi:MAG: hypothetical protein H7Z43_04785 [Clostridia bacterium]|nr:hypothetical protein [Deltaproteobacteria bacterium]